MGPAFSWPKPSGVAALAYISGSTYRTSSTPLDIALWSAIPHTWLVGRCKSVRRRELPPSPAGPPFSCLAFTRGLSTYSQRVCTLVAELVTWSRSEIQPGRRAPFLTEDLFWTMSVLRATDVQFRGASPARAGRSAGQCGLCVTSDRPRMTGELRLRLCWIAHKEQ